MAENLGLNINWNEEERRIAIFRPEFQNSGGGVFLWIGKNIVGIDEYDEIKIDTPPIIYKDRTMVPIRDISEIFEKDVRWDENSRTVYIKDK
ncbi:copper amine oxidase N-terminal domain-containing protein [Peptoniphilus sp. MSJ-1]|uniref:Copper amine oxidase N-terminal domain-containing protein n=1 Tax=Peptoniphilus ovalis TaxID=2841503 RepID=A0ABS6FI71_9FIRM|nr:copper amine oxidase N-terminal domain-containing protein [Peptoniphilus ovalis]